VTALLLGAAAANVGLLPFGGERELLDIQKFCASVAMPMLLFGADLTVVYKKSLRLFPPFVVAAAGTVAGAILGHVFVFGDGAPFANGEAYKIAAGLAADNVFALAYYPLNSWLSRREGFIPYVERPSADDQAMRTIGPEVEEVEDVPVSAGLQYHVQPTIPADDILGAVFASFALLTAGRMIAPDMMGPAATLLTVAFATIAPKSITDPLAEAGQVIGEALIFIIFVISGAAAGNLTAITASTDIFAFLLILYACHFAFVLLPPALSFVPYERREALLTSNACVGGPATAAALTQSLGWRDLTVPGVLIALVGNAAGTITGLSLAPFLAARL
jgi:uncharacterized membrane protein